MSLSVRFLSITLALTMLSQCSSSKKENEPEGATVSRIDRSMNKGFDRKKKQYDTGFRSEFDQKSYIGNKKVKGKKFRTGEFTGSDTYKGTSEFKAGEFAQSDKASRAGSQTFSQAGKSPRDATQTFNTDASRDASRSAPQSDKAFSQGDDVFSTRSVRDATKAQEKNVLPKIIKVETQGGETVYTEQDVKRMLNRN